MKQTLLVLFLITFTFSYGQLISTNPTEFTNTYTLKYNGGTFEYKITVSAEAKMITNAGGQIWLTPVVKEMTILSFEKDGIQASEVPAIHLPMSVSVNQLDWVDMDVAFTNGISSFNVHWDGFSSTHIQNWKAGMTQLGMNCDPTYQINCMPFRSSFNSLWLSINDAFLSEGVYGNLSETNTLARAIDSYAKEKDEQEKEEAAQKKSSEEKKKKSTRQRTIKDDFLSETAITATANNDSNTDFLAAAAAAEKSDDFIATNTSSKDAKKKYEIKYKDGKYGVVGKDGSILIPFKEWQISEYLDGVAKVKLKIDDVPFQGSFNHDVETSAIEVFKIGFVDKTGAFIDTPEIAAEGGCFIEPYYGLYVIPEGSSYEEEKKKRRIRKEKERNELERCKRMAQDKIELIKSRYQ